MRLVLCGAGNGEHRADVDPELHVRIAVIAECLAITPAKNAREPKHEINPANRRRNNPRRPRNAGCVWICAEGAAEKWGVRVGPGAPARHRGLWRETITN